MKYESTILKRLIDTYGVVGNPRYISEIIKEFIVRGKECFPNLFTYQADWLAHIDEFGLNPTYTVSYTGQYIYAPNTLERPVKSAILKGSTKYRDIDTGEVLDAFEDGRNLELVSVKMPVLTTSNEDGTKTNILSTPSDLELRGIGDVQDTLDCLTGEVNQRVSEFILDKNTTISKYTDIERFNTTGYNVKLPTNFVPSTTNFICNSLPKSTPEKIQPNMSPVDEEGIAVNSGYIKFRISNKKGANVEDFKKYLEINPIKLIIPLVEESIKTVDLTILDQNGQNVKQLMSFNGGTHFNTTSLEGSPLPVVSVSVETDLEETLMMCSLEGYTM